MGDCTMVNTVTTTFLVRKVDEVPGSLIRFYYFYEIFVYVIVSLLSKVWYDKYLYY